MCWPKAQSCTLNSYLLSFHLCRKACMTSCPAMPMKSSRHHRRPTSNIWMRASSREVRWTRMNWRGVTSCCGFMFVIRTHEPLTCCRGDVTGQAPNLCIILPDNVMCCIIIPCPTCFLSLSLPSIQALRARLAEGKRRLSGPTEGASETGSGKRQQPSAARTKDRGSR